MEDNDRRQKKPYSNSFRSLQAIWQVLRRHASPSHPLTVREICDRLKEMEYEADRPSPYTLDRIFPRGQELMSLLFPSQVIRQGETPPANTWLDADGLHIVVETPEGELLRRDDLDVLITREPFKAPSYSTVDKMLSQGIPFDLDTFPFRLRCVARIPGEGGRQKTVPYSDLEAAMSAENAEKNNVPRRYYLHSSLSEAEWRLFSDLIAVYPFLSEAQTRRFLVALNRLRPKPAFIPKRFAYKRGNPRMIKIIARLDDAIRLKRKVHITYGEHRLEKQDDGRWSPVLLRRRKNAELEVEPYALMWSNGNYYLIARHYGMMNLRADRILDAVLLDERFTVPPDFDPVRYRNSCPVMYPGKNQFVRMRCRVSMVNTLLDFFGDLPQYTAPVKGPDGDETTELTMSIAPAGVKLFALQYAGSVEVLEPQSLREEIARELEAAAEKYRC